jgi:hypothetical protein
MRLVITAAALATAFVASPAYATQGLLCRPVSGSGPSLSFILGAGGGIAAAHLREGAGAWNAVTVRQSWIDEHRMWVDLTDEQRSDDTGRLRATFVRRGRFWHVAGTFVRSGRVHRVRCVED